MKQRRRPHHVRVLLWIRDADVGQLDVQVLHRGNKQGDNMSEESY